MFGIMVPNSHTFHTVYRYESCSGAAGERAAANAQVKELYLWSCKFCIKYYDDFKFQSLVFGIMVPNPHTFHPVNRECGGGERVANAQVKELYLWQSALKKSYYCN